MSGFDTAPDSAGGNTPLISVIVPVWAAAGPAALELLERSLTHVNASSFRDFELLVADDGSPEGEAIREIALCAGARLVRLERRAGPAAARNAAARVAHGEIFVFLDADTSPHEDTLDRFVRKFAENSALHAVVGSYDNAPTAPGAVSRFRNLLHSFVHHRASRHASAFWAGCGAVRKDRFRALGGFDEKFPRPSIEDVEFGLRLRDTGGCMELDPAIQVTHHKTWTLHSMIRTDLLMRAIPWAGLLHRYPMPLDLNFKIGDRIAGALAALIPLLAWIAWRHASLWAAPFIALVLIAALNIPLFRFLARAGGWPKALLCFPLLLIYLETCMAGLFFGLAKSEHRRDRFLWAACALIGLVLLGIQISGGAFRAEFTGHSDEPAHFVSGLMLYDYLDALPKGNPLAWAGNYYLHYPKVAIGHWPPGYHMMEAVWWLLWGPSRATAMWLQWAIGLLAMTVLYRLCRAWLPLYAAIAIVALTIAAPVFQESLQEAMADLCCLLWTVLFMYAAVRFLKMRDRNSLFMLGFSLAMAAMTKGTAVCLVPVAVAVLLAGRSAVRISTGWIVAVGAALLPAAVWYLSTGDIRAWGGMSFSEPWPGKLIVYLAGWGFLALAALGLRRIPLALVSAGIVASALGCSLILRAMREERHWIIVLPAILVLAGFAVTRFRPAVAAILLVPALFLFPWSRFRQAPEGFHDLLRQVSVPSRMLVSGDGEGAWIAVTSLNEERPASYIVRATKVLAEEGWSGEGYHLLTASPEAVLLRIDELALDLVVLHSPQTGSPAPHQALLSKAVQSSAAWKECGRALDLLAYCRTLAPRVPRQALELKIQGMDLKETLIAGE